MDIPAAYDTAEKVCKEWLVTTDGSVDAGMRRIGTERFEKWVLEVEAVLEKNNPRE
jgi:hypothetical protein